MSFITYVRVHVLSHDHYYQNVESLFKCGITYYVASSLFRKNAHHRVAFLLLL